MTRAAVCKQYISTGKSARVATPSQFLMNRSALWRQDRSARSITGTQSPPFGIMSGENLSILGSLLTAVIFFLIKMTVSLKNALDVLQELQGVHTVDRCSALPSEFLHLLWMNSNTFHYVVCVFCGADIQSALRRRVINHAICLCWHCTTVAVAKYKSPANSKGVQLLPSFQVLSCCSIRSSQDLRCPVNIYHQPRSTRWWWTHRALSI